MTDAASIPDLPDPLRPWTERSYAPRIVEYTLIELVECTGVTRVYKGYDRSLDRYVAVQVLLPEIATDANMVRRFRAQIAAAARVAHPNVVPIYAVGEDDGQWYFVSQWVEGTSLNERLASGHQFPPQQAVRIVRECLAGLQAVHDHGMAHGQIEPRNILLEDETDRVLLTGLGLAELTSRAGTPGSHSDLLSTRRGRGDFSTDLPALGAVAFELLIGQPPSKLEAGWSLALQQLAPQVPKVFADLVARMLNPTGGSPHGDCEAFSHALREIDETMSGLRSGSARNGMMIIDPPHPPSFLQLQLGRKPRPLRKRLRVHARLLELLSQCDLLGSWRIRDHGGVQWARRSCRSWKVGWGVLSGCLLVTVLVLSGAIMRGLDFARPAFVSGSAGVARTVFHERLNMPSTTAAAGDILKRSDWSDAAEAGSRFGIPARRAFTLPAWPMEPAATRRTFDSAPSPHVVRFTGRQSLDIAMPEIVHDWMAWSYTFVSAVRFRAAETSHRLMGNLDPRPRASGEPGWALLQLPGGPATESDRSAAAVGGNQHAAGAAPQVRLAFSYRTVGGQIQRVVGASFEPRDNWWRIAVSYSREERNMVVHLGERRYLEVSPSAMLTQPSPQSFWIGCPEFAPEGFVGEVGGFAFHRQDNRSAPRFVANRYTQVLLDFAHKLEGQVLDISGHGNHAWMMGCEWQREPDIPLPPNEPAYPPPGKAYVLDLGPGACVELLGTRELTGPDQTFTVEMWFRVEHLSGEQLLFGDWEESRGKKDAPEFFGWGLILTADMAGNCLLDVRYGAAASQRDQISLGHPAMVGNQWYHVAFCSAPGKRGLYLNGRSVHREEREQIQPAPRTWLPSPRNLFLGRQVNPSQARRIQVRSLRLDAGYRYDKEFSPAPELNADDHTLLALDFSHYSSRPFIGDASGNEHEGLLVLASWFEVEKTWER